MNIAESMARGESLAKRVDHTQLKPDADRNSIARYCDEATEYGFCAVCVNPWFIPEVARRLANSSVKTCAVVGFPLGATLPAAKLAEARAVLDSGADEVDMVLCISALKEAELPAVHDDIAAIKQACGDRVLKVILETCLLSEAEIVRGCEISRYAGANFVKTSTGLSKSGATATTVRLMRDTVGDAMGVKASGGIRKAVDAFAMIRAGASRIGTSSGVKLLDGSK